VENGEWNVFENDPALAPSPLQGEGWGGVKISAGISVTIFSYFSKLNHGNSNVSIV
jgi:hypothetical protein